MNVAHSPGLLYAGGAPHLPGSVATRAATLKLFAVSIILALPFQSIPLPIPAQVAPLSSILAVAALPLVLLADRRVVLTPIAKVMLLFLGFLLLHSVVALFVDVVLFRGETIRVVSWLRQIVSLAAGVSVFWVMRSLLGRITDLRLAHLLVIGAIPSVLVGVLNIAWGAGVGPAGRIVLAIRSIAAPNGYNHPMRASGLSFEPSHFVWYLSVIVIPVAIALILADRRRRGLYLAFLVLALAAFGWTFSATGFVIAATMLVPAYRLGKRGLWLFGSGLAVAAVSLFVLLFPHNYMVAAVTEIWGAVRLLDASLLSASGTNLVFNGLGPFATVTSSLTSIGYGLGGTATHLEVMVPPVAHHWIMGGTWDGMPTLANMVGKVFGEAGAIGLILFLSLWGAAYYQIRCIRRHQPPTDAAPQLIVVASVVLVGLLAGYAIKHGSFGVPFFWFWLAYIDARYCAYRTGTIGHA